MNVEQWVANYLTCLLFINFDKSMVCCGPSNVQLLTLSCFLLAATSSHNVTYIIFLTEVAHKVAKLICLWATVCSSPQIKQKGIVIALPCHRSGFYQLCLQFPRILICYFHCFWMIAILLLMLTVVQLVWHVAFCHPLFRTWGGLFQAVAKFMVLGKSS